MSAPHWKETRTRKLRMEPENDDFLKKDTSRDLYGIISVIHIDILHIYIYIYIYILHIYIYMYFFLWGLFSGSMSLFFGGSDVSVGTFASQEDMA